MMAMLDAIDDGGQLAAHPAVQASTEDLGDLVAGQPPQAEFAAAFTGFIDLISARWLPLPASRCSWNLFAIAFAAWCGGFHQIYRCGQCLGDFQ
jgi:hypothetical protein